MHPKAKFRVGATCALALPVFVVACSPEQASAPKAPWFANEAAARGITYVHQSGFTGRPLLPEITGSGAALADLDGDGDLDAYIIQSGSLYPQEPGTVLPGNELYLNRGDGVFDKVPDGGGAGDTGYGMGVAAGDYDNDGDVDLYVTNVGANALLRNDGGGRFEDVTEAAGVGDPGWSTGAGFFDLDADGDLDLYVVNYINWSIESEIRCYVGNLLTYCPPANYNAPAVDTLYRNDGDGTFTDISVESGIGSGFGNGFGLVGADFTGNGRTDLFVANDMMLDQFWVNEGNLRFTDQATLWGSAVDEHGVAKAGMGVSAADIDNDGDTDMMVVNLEGQTDSFFRNEGRYFRDSTAELGLGITGRFTRFGVTLADFDNDGLLDLFEANGKVSAPSAATTQHGGYFEVEEARVHEDAEDTTFNEPNVLLRGIPGGRFEELSPRGGVPEPLEHTSRGLAVGDVNDDGGLDLLIINRDAPPYLLINRVPDRGNWIRFRPVLGDPPRDAYGATVSAVIDGQRIWRNVQPDGSYLAYSDPRPHFGLGTETEVEAVTVRWPGETEVEHFGDFEAGQTVRELKRGTGTVR